MKTNARFASALDLTLALPECNDSCGFSTSSRFWRSICPVEFKPTSRPTRCSSTASGSPANRAKTFPVYDPSSEEVIAQVPDANADDVNRAVAAAKAAFEDGPWATTTAQERGRVLIRLADKIRQNLAMLAELECRNTGKPIVEAEYDIERCRHLLRILRRPSEQRCWAMSIQCPTTRSALR